MSYFEEYEAALEEAAARKSQLARRPPVVALALLMVVVIGIAGVFAVVGGRTAAASTVTVRVEDDRVIIRVVRPDADPRQIVEDLESAGLDARIVAAPTGPSRVGQLSSVAALGDGITSAGPLEIQAPAGWSGIIDVAEGTLAKPGEQYVAPTNAFSPGEPLGCLSEFDLSVAEVAFVARSNGLTVEWRSEEEDQVAGSPPSRSQVTGAIATSDSTVIARFDRNVAVGSVTDSTCG